MDWAAERDGPQGSHEVTAAVAVCLAGATAAAAVVVCSVDQPQTGSCLCDEGFAAGEAGWLGGWPGAVDSGMSAATYFVAE